MNNRMLFIILGALIVIYALSQLLSGNRDSSFDTNSLQIDTSLVDRIDVDLLEGEDYYLEKNNGIWKGVKSNVEVEALPNAVKGMLTHAADIKVLRITTKDKDKWPNFEIEEGKAKAKITFKNGGKNLQTLIVGGFRFNQQARSAQSFVRTNEGDEVYAIDGFSSMSLGQTFDSFRDKTVLKIDKESISGIEIKSMDSSFGFQKTIGGWTDSEGTILDSTKVAGYLNTISNFRATGFNDNYNNTGDFQHTVSVQTGTQPTPFQIHLNHVEGAALPFAITSTQIPNIPFAGDSTSTYKKLILTKASFL